MLGDEGLLSGGVGGMSPVKETKTSIDLAKRVNATVGGSRNTSLSSALNGSAFAMVGGEAEAALVCLYSIGIVSSSSVWDSIV